MKFLLEEEELRETIERGARDWKVFLRPLKALGIVVRVWDDGLIEAIDLVGLDEKAEVAGFEDKMVDEAEHAMRDLSH